MHVVTIRTPTEFRPTLGTDGHAVTVCIQPEPNIEPEIRQHIDAVFNDREFVAGDSPPEMISTYLDEIAEPLGWLRDVGLQITAIISERGLPASGMRISVAAYYVHTPESAYSMQGAEPGTVQVHVFGPACAGAEALSKPDQAAFTLWPSRAAVEQAFEGAVPWCDDCFLFLLNATL